MTKKQPAKLNINKTPKKAGAHEKYTPQQFVDAIKACKGMKTLAANRVGCTYKTFMEYSRKYPEINEAVQDSREQMLDHVELKLYDRCMNGDTTALIFMLKTLGKQRGYQEKTVNYNYDMSTMSDDELRAIAEG